MSGANQFNSPPWLPAGGFGGFRLTNPPPTDPLANIFASVATPAAATTGAASAQADARPASTVARDPTAKKIYESKKRPLHDIGAQDSIVTVRVGSVPVIFNVHRGILLQSSEFLKAKAKPEWSKGEAVVDLTHLFSVTAFDVYSKWLYTSCIVPQGSRTQPPVIVENVSEYESLARAFVLGEELMDFKFKDAIMDALQAKVRKAHFGSFWISAHTVVRAIYNGTPQSSPARKFLVDIYHYHADATALSCQLAFPAEFLFDLARANLSRRTSTPISQPGSFWINPCTYHGHGKDEDCYLNDKS